MEYRSADRVTAGKDEDTTGEAEGEADGLADGAATGPGLPELQAANAAKAELPPMFMPMLITQLRRLTRDGVTGACVAFNFPALMPSEPTRPRPAVQPPVKGRSA